MSMRILLIEDEFAVRHWIQTKLHRAGHACIGVDTGQEALSRLTRQAFDAIILDRRLPDIDGLEVLSSLRSQEGEAPPVLILSANDQPQDRIDGLRAGADDYLGKPFNDTELLLRLEILVRRRQNGASDTHLRIGDLEIDLDNRSASRAGQHIALSDKEFRLLRVLAENRGQAVSRDMLLERVWGYQFDPQTNLIDVHLHKLRSKIDKGFGTPLIRTVRALGYVLG